MSRQLAATFGHAIESTVDDSYTDLRRNPTYSATDLERLPRPSGIFLQPAFEKVDLADSRSEEPDSYGFSTAPKVHSEEQPASVVAANFSTDYAPPAAPSINTRSSFITKRAPSVREAPAPSSVPAFEFPSMEEIEQISVPAAPAPAPEPAPASTTAPAKTGGQSVRFWI
jgi:hypothetical protein